MSRLPFNTGLCQGWSNPRTNYAIPTIYYLSGTYSLAGATTLVIIFGENFRLYSTIKFGTYTPTMIFINSLQINFYIPTSADYGEYPVQVFNDVNHGSNVVNYTIDYAPGVRYLSPNYSEVITNSNNSDLSINGLLQISNSINDSGGGDVSENIVFTDTLNQSINGLLQISNSINDSGGDVSENIVFTDTLNQSINGLLRISNSTNDSGGAVSGNIVFTDTLNQSINWFTSNASIFASASAIEIQGNLNISGTINGSSIGDSDYRIIDDIELLNDSCSVDNLRPIKFFNKKSRKTEIGFLAHEVQESFPFLVTGKKDDPDLQTLNHIGLIGILTKEIQLLKAEVAELKKIL